jgi:hypothetical protein
MLNGWTRATVRFRDQQWAKALYPLTLLSHSLQANWVDLAGILPPACWEEITLKALFGKQADTEMLPPVVGLLHAYPYPWSPKLAAAVWQRMRELLKPATFQQNNWSGVWSLVSGSLLAFAARAPFSFLPEAIDRLQTEQLTIPDSPFRGYWKKMLENTVDLMQLRHAMHQAFDKENA